MAFPTGTELINPTKLLEHANVREGFRVADFGCGTVGHYVFPASRLVGASGKVYAVDIMKSVLQAIRSRIELDGTKNVLPVWGDIERLRGVPLPNESLDVVLLVNNLFLAKDKTAMGHEALRLLKSGGTLVLADWRPTGAPFGPPPPTRVAEEQARLVMQSVGFRLGVSFEAGPYHYGLVFEKP
ncbi:methyltransferase domain-containing protein [Candidatus Uhrbacteria bacterium]|nr:methyltransferase domain-containing protein [Candidatus Uhrbacteria bacterium]